MMLRFSRASHLPLYALLLALLVFVPACGGGGDGDADSGDVDAGDDVDNGDTGDTGDDDATFTRIEIHSAPADWIADYRAGVALMKTRATNDPTSWQYQANIHGVPGNFSSCPAETTPDQTAWATCQHGQFFFLAWHRMYLYYFERIVRDAVAEATNGQRTDWALPYWDYEQFHALPEPFRVPANSSNSLFVSQRAGNCNAGQDNCVTASTASSTQALATTPTCSCPNNDPCDGCTPGLLPSQTFFGGWVPQATHFASVTGELESQPHNVVHNAVGGPGGWMADANCAARDPIFWLHHANIDRLWQVWLNEGGRLDPLASTTWKDEVFTFFDVENGMTVERQLTGCEVLNMATQLDYTYEGLPVDNVVLCDGPQPATASVASVPESRVLASKDTSVALGRDRASLSVKVPVSATASIGEDEEYRVVIDDLELVTHGAFYQVYLNLPQGADPDPEGPHFIGNLALFGHTEQQAGEGHEGHGSVRYSRSYDISDNVRELSAAGEWTGDVNLTLVRGNPAPATAAAEPDTFIRVGKVSVRHQR